MDDLRCVIEDLRIMFRNANRRIPVEAVTEILRRKSDFHLWIGQNVARFAGCHIRAGDFTAITASIYDIRVAGIDCNITALAAPHIAPVLIGWKTVKRATRQWNGSVILLRAVNSIRKTVIHCCIVNFRGGLIEQAGPRLSIIQGNARPAVAAEDYDFRIFRIDPEIMAVPMRLLYFFKRNATVARPEIVDIQDINLLLIKRICDHMHVVPGPLDETSFDVGVQPLPCLSRVIGTEQSAFCRLHDRPDAIWISRRNCYSNSSDNSLGQSTLHFQPVIAAIHCLI